MANLFRRRKKYSRGFDFYGYTNAIGKRYKTLSIRLKNTTDKPQEVDLFKQVNSAIQIQSSGGSYGQILNSLGPNPFMVADFKVIANPKEQLYEPLQFTYRDMYGQMRSESITPGDFTSAMQSIANQIDTLGMGMIVDINTSIQFTLLPGATLTLIMKVTKVQDKSKPLYSNATGYAGNWEVMPWLSVDRKIEIVYK